MKFMQAVSQKVKVLSEGDDDVISSWFFHRYSCRIVAPVGLENSANVT